MLVSARKSPTKPRREQRMLWGCPQIHTRNGTKKRESIKEKKNKQDLCNSPACVGEEAEFLNDLHTFPKRGAEQAGLAPGYSSLIPDQICLATEILFFSSVPALQFNLDWQVKSSVSPPLFLLCCSSEVKSMFEGSNRIFLARGILRE